MAVINSLAVFVFTGMFIAGKATDVTDLLQCNPIETLGCLPPKFTFLSAVIGQDTELYEQLMTNIFLGEKTKTWWDHEKLPEVCRLAQEDLDIKQLVPCLQQAWTCQNTPLTNAKLTWDNVTKAVDRLMQACNQRRTYTTSSTIIILEHLKAIDWAHVAQLCRPVESLGCLPKHTTIGTLGALYNNHQEALQSILFGFLAGGDIHHHIREENIKLACKIAHIDLDIKKFIPCLKELWSTCKQTPLTYVNITWATVDTNKDKLIRLCEEDCGDMSEHKRTMQLCKQEYERRDIPDIIGTKYALKQCNIPECRTLGVAYNCSQTVIHSCPEIYSKQEFPKTLEEHVDDSRCLCGNLPYEDYCEYARGQQKIYCKDFVDGSAAHGYSQTILFGCLLLAVLFSSLWH